MAERRYTVVPRDAVVVSGPDAVTYLQGQLSQDVAALEMGASAWSWVLQPAGKVDALVRVTRTGPDELLVDVDEGFQELVLHRLARFKLRTKADLEPTTVAVLALRGPGAIDVARELAAAGGTAVLQTGDGAPDGAGAAGRAPGMVAVAALWPSGEEAGDVLMRDGAAAVLPDAWSEHLAADAWEAERIAAGVPAMGAELTDRTIPAETGLVAITASFTKGCYTGQELVARIDSRGGNVPRHLRRLRSAMVLVAGDELTNADGKVVATITSAALHPDAGVVGLAYVARSVGPGDPVASAHGPVTLLGLDS